MWRRSKEQKVERDWWIIKWWKNIIDLNILRIEEKIIKNKLKMIKKSRERI
jgi:hypothetical protein